MGQNKHDPLCWLTHQEPDTQHDLRSSFAALEEVGFDFLAMGPLISRHAMVPSRAP